MELKVLSHYEIALILAKIILNGIESCFFDNKVLLTEDRDNPQWN
jgi:hypothetical protein